MWLLRRIWNFIDTYRCVIKDVRNYIYICKTLCRAQKDSEKFKELNVKLDWICRPYTVVVLTREDIKESSEIQHIKVMEKITPLNRYLDWNLGLAELLIPAIKEEKISGKVVDGIYRASYNPYFEGISIKFILSNILLIVGGWYLIHHTSFIHWTILLYNKIIELKLWRTLTTLTS